MKLSVAVQHHPLRAHLIEPLVARLGPCEVVTDPDPDSPVRSALRTYLLCLSQTPDEATHRLIVQDDAWPCDDFRARAEAAIAEHPDELTALFVPGVGAPGDAVKLAVRRSQPFTRLPVAWTPTVALSWPAAHARAFVEFAATAFDHRHQGDDGPVGKYRREAAVHCWAPVPSLVEHPDVEPSLFRRMPGQAGRNRARIAAAPP